jgi:hypothetical protein
MIVASPMNSVLFALFALSTYFPFSGRAALQAEFLAFPHPVLRKEDVVSPAPPNASTDGCVPVVALLVGLARRLQIVQPDTVVRWH